MHTAWRQAPPPRIQAHPQRVQKTNVGFAQFPDIAVPAGATMDVERSLVLGARDAWIGRLSMNTGQSPAVSYDFFLREMPKYRWEEITTVRSETSVLTFSRDSRVATIQIRKRHLAAQKSTSQSRHAALLITVITVVICACKRNCPRNKIDRIRRPA